MKQRHKQLKKNTIQNVPKTQKVARLPAKMPYDFFLRSENTAPATQNGRAQIHWWPQVKMHFFELKNSKNRGSPARGAKFERDE